MVSKVYYAVSFTQNGTMMVSPEALMPRGLTPTQTDTSAALVAANLPDLCRCVASRNFVIFVQADNVDMQQQDLQDGITMAWRDANEGTVLTVFYYMYMYCTSFAN